MFIKSIEVTGLAALEHYEVTGLSRVVRVTGDAPACMALADALTIGLSAFSVEDARRAAALLGLGDAVEVTGQGLPEEIHVEHPAIASQLVARPAQDEPPHSKGTLEFELDPPQFRRLRQSAQRDPRLVSALAEDGATVRVVTGWAFTNDYTWISCSILSFRVGGLDLPAQGKESPAWLPAFLKSMAGRNHRRRPLEVDAISVAKADRSPSAEQRATVHEMRSVLSRSPFRLGALEIVEPVGAEPYLALAAEDGQLLPLRAMGPAAKDMVGLVQAVLVGSAEILLLESPTAFTPRTRSLLTWLHAQAEADGSALEQIWLFGVEGADALVMPPRQPEPEPA